MSDLHKLHETIYGYHRAGDPLQAVNIRAIGAADPDDLVIVSVAEIGGPPRAIKETRAAYCEKWGAYRDVPVFEQRWLPQEESISGPPSLNSSSRPRYSILASRRRSTRWGT